MSKSKYRAEGDSGGPKFWQRWFQKKKTARGLKDLKEEIDMVRTGYAYVSIQAD